MRKVDRIGWHPGPWDQELDYYAWITTAKAPGLMVRNHLGSWCGYICVFAGHPDYGKPIEEIDASVHGGVTYAGPRPPRRNPKAADEWWIGFDCSHYGDLSPSNLIYSAPTDAVARLAIAGIQTYKDEKYVRAEAELLAYQLRCCRAHEDCRSNRQLAIACFDYQCGEKT